MRQKKVRQLTEIQVKAAQGLASGLSQESAAVAAGASRRSVSRWLSEDPLFQKKVSEFSGEIHQVKIEVIKETTREFSLENLIPKALNVVGEILEDAEERAANKLKAASLIGNWVGMRGTSTSDEDVNQGFPGDSYLKESQTNGYISDSELSRMSDEQLTALYFQSLNENRL